MIYAIGDLHLDSTNTKPMDIFGTEWENHEDKIFRSWSENVKDEDLVLIPGDISWALKLEEAKKDLEKIDNLPGIKILIKGNHDYWWGSTSKLKSLG
ncbi:serine/threonine protein phosphatase, partial [Vibrio parahaemolyticus]|nr:serine/threonine protein phosphatase [Vibrio parahaemolyticus]